MISYLLGEFLYYIVVSTGIITPVVAGGVILIEKVVDALNESE